jgi:methyl-accepting chemotaxis protein
MESHKNSISQEVQIKNGAALVIRTDLEGIITYANDEFVSNTGFIRTELLGASHNIIYHPTMPAIVFDDLWMTLKALRPWQCIVKNRTKSGAYYWSETTIMPIFENGKVHEYLSVQRTARLEQIEQAEHLYQLLNAKQTLIRPTGLTDMVKFVEGVDIRKKIALALAAFLLPIFCLMYQLFLAQDYRLLSGVAVSITVASLIGFNVLKNFTTLLHKIIGIFYRMIEKKFGHAQGLAGNTLLGDIWHTLYLMELNLELAQAKDDASRLLKISQSLSHVHVGVMVTDDNFEVIYMNDSVLEIFKKAAGKAASTRLSNSDTDKAQTESARQLSVNAKQPYESELHIAGQVIRFSICL